MEPELLPIATIDIDGVLADVRHRLHHLNSRPKDWNAFFAAAPDDPPLRHGVELANRLAADHRIIYLTGRPERCRADTLAWFAMHDLPGGELLMRRDDDRRPARLTKVYAITRLARNATVALAVDDDPLVCDAIEAAGFTVLRADWATQGSAANALYDAQEHEGRT